MTQEQFKLIRTDFNRIIETINKTKILGKDKYISKFKKYNKHIKTTLDFPKIKAYGEELSYECDQLLVADTVDYGYFDSDQVYLELSLDINIREDYFKAKANIFALKNKSLSEFNDTRTSDKELFNETIQGEDLIDFLEKFRDLYEKITTIKFNGDQLIDSCIIEDLELLIKIIKEKLKSE